MRNIWTIMKTFHVLPTDPNFRALEDTQLELMVYSLEEDYRLAELASKGLSVESDHYDSTFEEEVWRKDINKWDVLKDGHDADDIAKQIAEMTQTEDASNLASKFDSLEEYNDYLANGGETVRESEVTGYINEQIKRAEERARELEGLKDTNGMVDDRDIAGDAVDSSQSNPSKLDKDLMDKSIALFEDNEDDEYTVL